MEWSEENQSHLQEPLGGEELAQISEEHHEIPAQVQVPWDFMAPAAREFSSPGSPKTPLSWQSPKLPVGSRQQEGTEHPNPVEMLRSHLEKLLNYPAINPRWKNAVSLY